MGVATQVKGKQKKKKKKTPLTSYKPCKTKHETRTRIKNNTKYKTIKKI
jgi:hypothetical protein